MKKSELLEMIRTTVARTLRESSDVSSDLDQDERAYADHLKDLGQGPDSSHGSSSMVSDDLLDDATELLMMVTGRIMAAKEIQVSSDVLASAVHHIEQADGILAKAGLSPESSDISHDNIRETVTRIAKKLAGSST